MGRHMRLITAAIVALAGCTESQSGGPTGLRPSADLLELTDPTSVAAFVTTGGVDVVFIDESPTLTAVEEPKQHISYDAKLLRDESFQGQFQAQVKIGDGLVGLHGTIKCFVIQANRARVIAMVTNINAPPPEASLVEGSLVEWTSEDNGEGSGHPDRQSAIIPSTGLCPLMIIPDVDLMPTVSGNVQIHPAQLSQ